MHRFTCRSLEEVSIYVCVRNVFVRTRIGVCVRVSVCGCFVDASFTVAVQIQVSTCVLVYEYLYVSASWLPGICMRVRE